jgi:hypothetical protein
MKLIANILLYALENIGSLKNIFYRSLAENTDEVIISLQYYKKNPLSMLVIEQEWDLLS